MDYDLIDTFPEPDDDFAPLPECGEWTRGETCGDSLCPAHGSEVQANLRATAELSWVGAIALAREIVRTQDVAERYARGEVPPVEPLEPGDLALALAKLWSVERRAGDLWSDFAEGLLAGLGYALGGPTCYECGARATCYDSDESGGYHCDGCCGHGQGASAASCTPITDLDHGGTPEQAAAWRAGRMWALAWVEAEQSGDDPRRWQPDPERLPWAQPVCRDSAQTRRYQRLARGAYLAAMAGRGYVSAMVASARRCREERYARLQIEIAEHYSAVTARHALEAESLSKLARPWEPAADVVSADGRARALEPVEVYP